MSKTNLGLIEFAKSKIGTNFNEFIKNNNNIEENKNFIEDFMNELYPTNGIGIDSNTYLVSFSNSKKESLPMWVNYGGDSVGTKIEIDTSFFDTEDFKYIDTKENNNLKIESCLYSVIYVELNDDDTYKLDNANSNLNNCIETISATLNEIATHSNKLDEKDKDKINTLDIVRDILDQVRFLFKSDAYAYEEEVRVVKLRYKDDPKGIFLSEVDDVIKVPKLYIELEKDIPYEDISITLGAKVQKPKEVANYLKHIGVGEVTKSKMPYQ